MPVSDSKFRRSFRPKINVGTKNQGLLGRLLQARRKEKSRCLNRWKSTIYRLLFKKKKQLLEMKLACVWQRRGYNPKKMILPYEFTISSPRENTFLRSNRFRGNSKSLKYYLRKIT